MNNDQEFTGLNRREFLKVGVLGTTSAILGTSALGKAVEYCYAAEPFVFPAPVYRTLGRTGMKITVVGFGAMLTPEPEVIGVAFDHGVNYVDTARKYMGGKNEEIVAKALKGRRDKIHVATKTPPSSVTKAEIIADVEASLKALETDYIDVIQLHNVTEKDRLFNAETREALVKLKTQGKVRFFGITTHKNQADILNALVDDPDHFFDTALIAVNFKSESDIFQAIERAAKANVGIIAMKTQAGGYATEALGKISPHQAALKWILQNKNITAAIPGMKDLSHLKEDIAVMGMPFDIADARILKTYDAAVASYYCHLCGKCEETCSLGVEISTVNRSLMYAEGYKSLDLARATYREISVNASALACTNCSECTAQCVNGLNIRVKMDRARQLLA
jgi:uncharacterized protein